VHALGRRRRDLPTLASIDPSLTCWETQPMNALATRSGSPPSADDLPLPGARRAARSAIFLLAACTACLDAAIAGGDDAAASKESASAAAPTKTQGSGDGQEPEQASPFEVPVSTTRGVAVLDGVPVAYTATAGSLLMKTDAGKPQAHVFYVAYVKDEGGPDRPLTFCFNGGPGSSSVWLHLGMLGPYRVQLDSHAGRPSPGGRLAPNPHALLDVTDLVFIDPVSTGFSRAAQGTEEGQFHGYEEDLRSVGQFIHDYATREGRWGSPKFLLGESYGGLRAAGLSGLLQQRYRMYLNGIVLVSAVIDFQTLQTRGANDLAYGLFLPAYAATAWYHRALGPQWLARPVDEVAAAAARFAAGPYARALRAGDGLSPKRRARVVAEMASLTGLSAEYVARANLRVPMAQFAKELLRERREVVGRFDSRYVGYDENANGATAEHDPSAAALFGPFTAAVNQYLRDTLKVSEERVYEILTDRVQPWDYGDFVNRYVDASGTLRRAILDNPSLRVFAACGLYDLATPTSAMRHSLDHLGLPEELRSNVELASYESGHMMYVHEPSLVRLRADLIRFYAAAAAVPAAAPR
jgi:carboxypeptidase C (cathepsin A)